MMMRWLTRLSIPRRIWIALAGISLSEIVVYGWIERIALRQRMILFPYLLERGYVAYQSLIFEYPPGWVWAQAPLYDLIPDHNLRLRLLQIIVMLVSTALVFWLGLKWRGALTGLIAAALYAAWGPIWMYAPIYYEVMIGLLALIAVVVWHEADARRWRPLVAGIALGTALVVKQHAIAPIAVFIIWRLLSLWARRDGRKALADIGLFLAGAAILPGIIVLIELAQGQLAAMWYWTWVFPIIHPDPFEAASLSELLLRCAWLFPVPVYVLMTVRSRSAWRSYPILLLGLSVALLAPGVTRYDRAHLSADVPVIALIGALAIRGALDLVQTSGSWRKQALRAFGGGMAALAVIALILPWYYFIKLGPRDQNITTLSAVAAWMKASGVPDGARVYMLPQIDGTDNLHALGGYLPPTYWKQTYLWEAADVHVIPSYLDSLNTTPPPYALFFEQYRKGTPPELVDFLLSHYTPMGDMQASDRMGKVILYRHN
jgi:4-amino-4-deoxy-L-arabinose transferase-like glycosyltransferase